MDTETIINTDKKSMDMNSLKNSILNKLASFGTQKKVYDTKSKKILDDKTELVINYEKPSLKGTISKHTIEVLKTIMQESGNTSIQINSTIRNSEGQALIMYNYLVEPGGIKSQLKLYGSNGDKVINVYSDKYDKKTNLSNMQNKINELSCNKVSLHCDDPLKVNVLDIQPTSIKHKDSFIKAFRKNPSIDQKRTILPGGGEHAYHLVIPQ
ncbi:MAG: hypothetical protein ACOYO1_00640 [Bacteroidales bacterium]